MRLAEIAIIPLAAASFCETCQIISNCLEFCPNCAGSNSIFNLAPVLNQESGSVCDEKSLESCYELHAV